ncbi:conserved hypothetical protein, partial [delta proteobacterium NaphS2]
ERYEAGRPTIITTNLQLNNGIPSLNQRTWSMLCWIASTIGASMFISMGLLSEKQMPANPFF